MKMKRFFRVTLSLLLMATLSMFAFAQQNLPEGAIARLGKGDMHDMAYSPDGGLLAMAVLADIWLYDTRNGQEVARLAGHTGAVSDLSFSPDGKTLATAGDDGVHLWDVATHTLRHTLSAEPPMSFSPDSKTLAAEDSKIFGGAVRLWDVATGESLQKIFQGGYVGSFISVSFSGEGQTLAVAHWRGVRLYDVATGRLRHIVNPSATYLRGNISFDPAGKTFASWESSSWESRIEVWDISTGALRNTLGLEGRVSSVSFSPDGQILASGSSDGTVRLWNVATGRPRKTLEGHTNRVVSFSFSADGQTLASVSSDNTVHLWDVTTGTLRKTFAVEGDVDSVSFSPDGQTFVSASDDRGEKTVRLWNVATGTLQHTFEGYTSNVNSVSFSPDGQTLASGSEFGVRLWDVTTHTLLDTRRAVNWAAAISFSPDGQTLASAGSAGVFLWDVATRTLRPTPTLEEFTSNANSVSFSPDGQILASGSDDGVVYLLDVSTGALQNTLEGHVSNVNSVSFSPDGKTLASGSDDETVRLWDVSDGTLLRTIPIICVGVNSVSFSPDGQTLASLGSDGVRLWDVATGTLRNTIREAWHPISFSPDSKTLASGSDDETVQLWDVATRTLRHTFEGHLADVNSVSFSPDGKTLASASDDGQILLWRVGQWEEEPANAPASIQVSLLPQETALLANYPNPFNPETWIPYQLATATDVTLTIYNIQGRVVRNLDLGHQRAGMYHIRSRAAYWDGRNAQGESVASGVYFYTLTAGDFSATRKLLIRK